MVKTSGNQNVGGIKTFLDIINANNGASFADVVSGTGRTTLSRQNGGATNYSVVLPNTNGTLAVVKHRTTNVSIDAGTITRTLVTQTMLADNLYLIDCMIVLNPPASNATQRVITHNLGISNYYGMSIAGLSQTNTSQVAAFEVVFASTALNTVNIRFGTVFGSETNVCINFKGTRTSPIL